MLWLFHTNVRSVKLVFLFGLKNLLLGSSLLFCLYCCNGICSGHHWWAGRVCTDEGDCPWTRLFHHPAGGRQSSQRSGRRCWCHWYQIPFQWKVDEDDFVILLFEHKDIFSIVIICNLFIYFFLCQKYKPWRITVWILVLLNFWEGEIMFFSSKRNL